MNKKGFSLTVVLTILIIVLCFSQVAFGEETCPCEKDTAGFVVPVDDGTFKIIIVPHPISNSDKLSKSSSAMGTSSSLGLWRIDKDSNLHEMTNGFAYRDDLTFYAITDIIGTVDGDSWTTDIVMPDGRIITFPTITYYYNEWGGCYICDYWTLCGVEGMRLIGMRIRWIIYYRCLPTGIYTFRFYQNGSIVGSSSFEMKEIQFDHFALWFDKDTLAYGEKTSIYARAEDTNDEMVALCPDARINFSLDENGALYGNLIGPYGERAKSLTGVPYILAVAGLVKYVVDGEDPNGPKTVGVIVNNNYGVSGSGSVVVKDSISLTLAIPTPKEIWPTLRPLDGDNQNNVNRRTKGNIQISLKKNGEPVPNQNVTLTVEMILPSGGHDHTNPPPVPLLGHLVAIGASTVEGDGEVMAQTDGQGNITVTYTAPEFGGRFELSAKTEMDGKIFEAKDELTVRVPELVELELGSFYELIGAPQNHSGTNDPCRSIPPASNHSRNHFGIENLGWAIRGTAARYFLLNNNVRLRINDISLEYGGLFDCSNDWNIPHRSHRIGTNADIGFNGIDSNSQCVQVDRGRLEQLFDEHTNSYITEGDHYHITVN